jgi:hypothetical protein
MFVQFPFSQKDPQQFPEAGCELRPSDKVLLIEAKHECFCDASQRETVAHLKKPLAVALGRNIAGLAVETTGTFEARSRHRCNPELV